ncbi:MAG: hypothetical protein J6J35_02230 [Alphaproteobacteria bacterium]|nr:hypothetical protein [Alphaproteobacteria bacterium]
MVKTKDKKEAVSHERDVEVENIHFKSTFLRDWIVLIVIFVLFFVAWGYIYKALNMFYDTFHIFCEWSINPVMKPSRHLSAILILFLSSLLLFIYLSIKFETYKPKNEKGFLCYFTKAPKFIKIILGYILSCVICFAIFLPIQYTLKKTTGITFCSALTRSEEGFDTCPSCGGDVFKPIIYLYPTETTDVSVKLGAKEKLTHTYPKYVEEWNVRAEPNGDLTDTVTGRKYYALYWEGTDADLPRYDDGFVVAKDEVVPFLEEKLAVLGLNEREANEFIIYWLPKLESAPYTFIHFVSQEEQNKNMPLTIQPEPDMIIRVLMAFKSLDKPIEVKEQILPEMPKRNGFTVIEWGGTEIPVL